MDLHEKIQDINNRWKIPSDESYEEKFIKFKRRILNFLSDIDLHVTEESISLFCNAMGIKEVWHQNAYDYSKWSKNIINELNNEQEPKKFFRLLEIIFALDITTSFGYGARSIYDRENLIQKTKQSLEFSDINVAMKIKDEDVIFYPSGSKVLDKEIVDKALDFLSGSAHQHFTDALKFYQENSPKSRVKSAESLRRTLEEFLKLKLKNQKGLKENISVIGNELKVIKANNDIKNLVTKILSTLDQFFNENSKHKDGNIDEPENEYLIYQIGLLMRYIEKIIN